MRYIAVMKEIIRSDEFKNLSFNVLSVKSILKEIPEITKIGDTFLIASRERPDFDQAVKYIVLMYDKLSPLTKKFMNISERKKNAFVLAGYSLEKDAEHFDEFENFKDEQVLDMTIEYLRYQNDHLWTMLVSNEQAFFEYQKALLAETLMIRNDKDKIAAISTKTKLMQDSNDIVDRIDRYYRQIFVEDKIVNYAKGRRVTSPEAMALN